MPCIDVELLPSLAGSYTIQLFSESVLASFDTVFPAHRCNLLYGHLRYTWAYGFVKVSVAL